MNKKSGISLLSLIVCIVIIIIVGYNLFRDKD